MVFMNVVSNFLLPGVALSASEDLEGKAIPISNSFLMFGKKSTTANFKASTKSSDVFLTI